MHKAKLFVIIIAQLLILGGCASSQRKATEKLHTLIGANSFDQAILYAESKEFYHDQNSKLIKLFELGMLHHLKSDYVKALDYFEQAKQLGDDLYTVSISKKVKSFLTNGNSDNYYGERFERSILRLYLALDYYLMSQSTIETLTDKDRREYFSKARASILEWDSMLEGMKSELDGDSVYKTDLSAKIVGAFIHEQMGTRSDLQVAMQLYYDAKKVLIRNYSGYPSFNVAWKEYKENYSKFPKLGEDAVKQAYIKASRFYTELEAFVDHRINKLKSIDDESVKVVYEYGLISSKKPKQYDFPLPMSSFPIIIGKGMGPAEFVARALSSGVAIPTISYELPIVEAKEYNKDFTIIVYDAKKVEVARSKLVLINPLSDLAFEALDEKIGSIKATVGMRVAMKHVLALSASYATYKQLLGKNSGSEFVAYMVAIASYAAANKAIRASEQADVRHWSLLPHGIYFSSFSLPDGVYEFSLVSQAFKSPDVVEKVIPNVTVKAGKTTLINIR